MALKVFNIPCLSDNYTPLLHDDKNHLTAIVDSPEFSPVDDFLKQHQWNLDYILNTHHHHDHTGANLKFKAEYSCKIIGNSEDQQRIPGLDIAVEDQARFQFGDYEFQVIQTYGHTLGHIAYYCSNENLLFIGDTLFAMGCGRLFEGTPEQMMRSLGRVKKLPPQTLIYCAHEYTLKNCEFALAVEPQNPALKERYAQTLKLRNKNLPTVPFLLEQELQTNPFLRTDSKEIREKLKLQDATDLEVFTRLREMRNDF